MDDLRAQARDTLTAAQRGAFLPDGFRFASTSDKMVESFSETLNATSNGRLAS